MIRGMKFRLKGAKDKNHSTMSNDEFMKGIMNLRELTNVGSKVGVFISLFTKFKTTYILKQNYIYIYIYNYRIWGEKKMILLLFKETSN